MSVRNRNRLKYMVNLLKAWYGGNATTGNEFCYSYVSKKDPGMGCSHMCIFDRMYKGRINGGLRFAYNQ